MAVDLLSVVPVIRKSNVISRGFVIYSPLWLGLKSPARVGSKTDGSGGSGREGGGGGGGGGVCVCVWKGGGFGGERERERTRTRKLYFTRIVV